VSQQRKGLETEHRSRHSLHRSMVLFDNIIEIFDAADFDVRLMAPYRTAAVLPPLVDCDLLRSAILTDRLAQEA
jgi:hypothetical protein